MSEADFDTIVRLTDEASPCAALPPLGSRKAILVVFNRARSQWLLLIGDLPGVAEGLTDYDDAVQLEVDTSMSRAEVQHLVERKVEEVVEMVATREL
jgi:hypothetical protein